jgi:glutathione S-transferase
MILVGQYDSPFVRRVGVSLHLLGIPFERDTRSVFADAEEMRRINPLGRIPSLVLESGEVLIDSAAILDHIDETIGRDRALLPASGSERRRALRLVALAAGAVDKAGAIVYERVLRPAEKQHEPWIERCRTQLQSAMMALEAGIGDGWCLGERMMTPDIMIGCFLGYLPLRLPESMPPGRYPGLETFARRCEATEPFCLTRPAADETMPTRPASA